MKKDYEYKVDYVKTIEIESIRDSLDLDDFEPYEQACKRIRNSLRNYGTANESRSNGISDIENRGSED